MEEPAMNLNAAAGYACIAMTTLIHLGNPR
jgi:hypothetical protein